MALPFDRRAYQGYYNEGYRPGHQLNYAGDSPCACLDSRYAELRKETVELLKSAGVANDARALVLELGCAMGQLHDTHPGWIGIELSRSATERIRQSVARRVPVVVGDMQELPFARESIDAIYSWAAIEHVPNPARVMCEIERVLKPGGVAILAPAWNCRSWTVKRLPLRRYRDLSLRLQIEKLTIPLRNHLAWRALQCLPGRIYRELLCASGQAVALDFRPLSPDFSLNLPHISDDDALASIDPHAALAFFHSRKWEILSHPTFAKRMSARHEPVVVRKPAR